MSDTTTPTTTALSAAGVTNSDLGERYAGILRGEIRDGVWGSDRIVRRADLADRFGISLDVVARTVRLLLRWGLVETRGAVGMRPKTEGRSWSAPHGGTQADHIAHVLRTRITDGTYDGGERLPSLRELAREFTVSHSMIGSAVKALKAEGLIVGGIPQTGFYTTTPQHTTPQHTTPQHTTPQSATPTAHRPPPGQPTAPASSRREATVRAVILTRIRAGAYRAGQQLPKRSELAAELGAGLETVREALEPLRRDGTLYVVHGQGTFIARQDETSLLHGPDDGVHAMAHRTAPQLRDGADPLSTPRPDQLITVTGGGVSANGPGTPRPRSYQAPGRRGGHFTGAAPVAGTAHQRRVRDTVVARIDDHTYRPGTRIPAVALAAQLSVSHDTVRLALASLAAQECLHTRGGGERGYFVTEGPAVTDVERLRGFDRV